MFKRTLNIVIAIAIVYIVFGIFLFVNQRSIIYHPNDQDFHQCSGFESYEKLTVNGTRFYFKANQDNLIVYYHGNAGSACDRSKIRSVFEKANASVMFVEYTGYSNDSVEPSKERILEDVRNVHQYVDDYENIVVYGQSIGSAAASYHASLGHVDDLILVTPFAKLADVVQSKYMMYPAFLLTERYDNSEWLQHYEGSLLIVHGDNDMVIPNRFSKDLFENVPTKDKRYVLIEGSGHNDLWSSSVFRDTIRDHIDAAE
ncbi:MAG: alpha/beta hydrolase [Nanobdellota archaeon]